MSSLLLPLCITLDKKGQDQIVFKRFRKIVISNIIANFQGFSP